MLDAVLSIGKTCLDCGKRIADASTRCKKCSCVERNKRVIRKAHLHPRWNGGRGVGSDGYAWVYINGKQRKEHVLIAESVLGRKLKWRVKGEASEVVHHINGDKTDNRHCNLLICTQKYHRELHDRMGRFWQQEHFGGPRCSL